MTSSSRMMNNQGGLQGPAYTPIHDQQPRKQENCCLKEPETSSTSQSESADQLFEESGAWIDEGSGTKRPRTTRACDGCRVKKIKCDGEIPACSRCRRYNRECTFRQVEKKKKRAVPKGARYIDMLEQRLNRMESLLLTSGLVPEDRGGKGTQQTSLDTKLSPQELKQGLWTQVRDVQTKSQSVSPTPNTPQTRSSVEPSSTKASPASSKEAYQTHQVVEKEQIDLLSDEMGLLMTNHSGESKYIGLSSGFGILSPQGVQWVEEKSGGVSSLQELFASAICDDGTRPGAIESFAGLFQRPVYQKLPTKKACYALVEQFFRQFNCVLPLFHQPTFMYLLERHYSADPHEGSGWWACLNVVLAVTHRLRVVESSTPIEEDRKSWGYMKNAIGVLSELIVQNNDLFSVQALLGMALFMQGTSNPQPTFVFVAAAVRSSHGIGLHKRGSGFNLNPIENEQRKRVFWIAYFLDKDISLRSGRPPCQDDDDMSVELPSLQPEDNVGTINVNDTQVNLFRLVAEFAVIQGSVYKKLYSTAASRQPAEKLLEAVRQLDEELEDWKNKLPKGYQPGDMPNMPWTIDALNFLMLHFSYYNCLSTIHRMSGYWASRVSLHTIQDLNVREVNPSVFISSAVCTSAARGSIGLLKFVPQEDAVLAWLIIHYPVSCLLTLVSNILQNPHDSNARADLDLMDAVINFLTRLDVKDDKGDISKLILFCKEFKRIAKAVTEKWEKQTQTRMIDSGKVETSVNRRHPNKHVGTLEPLAADLQRPEHVIPGMGNQLNGQILQATPNFRVNLNGENDGFPGFEVDETLQNYSMLPENGQLSYDPMQQMHHIVSNTDFDPPVSFTSFQQAYIPQDLWNMPMSMDWDWNDDTSNGVNGLGNGNPEGF